MPAKKKRLLPIHSLDFEADSDDSSGCCSHPQSLSSVPAAPDSLQVRGLSFLPHPSWEPQVRDRVQTHHTLQGLGSLEGLSWQHGRVGRRAVEGGAWRVQGGCLSRK